MGLGGRGGGNDAECGEELPLLLLESPYECKERKEYRKRYGILIFLIYIRTIFLLSQDKPHKTNLFYSINDLLTYVVLKTTLSGEWIISMLG